MKNCFDCKYASEISVDGVFANCVCDSEPCFDVWLDCLNFEKRKDVDDEKASEGYCKPNSVCDL